MSFDVADRTRSALGSAETVFSCCDTTFRIEATGLGAEGAVERARRTATDLEATLNAFDPDSAVTRLDETGSIADEHVAAVVRRGLEYEQRTGGAFSIRAGGVQRRVKPYIRSETDARPTAFDPEDTATITVDGSTVETDAPVDLNGLAKGYIVDRAAERLGGLGRTGFVDGGGDISSPTGPVAIESPYGDERPLRVLSTPWNIATSAGYRRQRGGIDHIYDPQTGSLGSKHDIVTVVARRDCMEADALATTLSGLPLDDALSLSERWPDLEAFVVHGGVFSATEGFEDHVA